MFSDSINVFFKQVRKNIIYFSIELFLNNDNNDKLFLYLTWGSEALRQENRESSPPDPASIPPNPDNVHGQIVHKLCQIDIVTKRMIYLCGPLASMHIHKYILGLSELTFIPSTRKIYKGKQGRIQQGYNHCKDS